MTPRWHIAKSPDWLRTELDKAADYKDAEQRMAAGVVTAYLDGAAVDVARVSRALWALGGPMQTALIWSEEKNYG